MTTAERSGARLLWVTGTGMLALALLASGCASAPGSDLGGDQRPAVPKTDVRVEPGGGTEINPKSPMKVSVPNGRLDGVGLFNQDGKPVQGQLAPDGTSWTATEKLGYGKTYSWRGKAIGQNREPVPVAGEFSTIKPGKTVRATISPSDDSVVGVGMPVSVKFNSTVRDKASVERALKVDTSQPVEGSWAWVSDKQVDYRPKEYWPANTQVKVEANLYGVPHGAGAYGVSDVSTDFTVGRSQVVKANAKRHQLVVERDGKRVASYPASYGEDNDPQTRTR